MTAVYEKARDAYRALCDLEDALDASPAAPPSERERLELQTLLRRWEHDTHLKIERQFARESV